MPATGKTTVARALAKELQLSLATKDDLKELLYDELGTGDSEWSRRLGRAAYALIFAFCRELLGAGRPAIAEANFFAGSQEEQFAALPPHRTVQIHCHAPSRCSWSATPDGQIATPGISIPSGSVSFGSASRTAFTARSRSMARCWSSRPPVPLMWDPSPGSSARC